MSFVTNLEQGYRGAGEASGGAGCRDSLTVVAPPMLRAADLATGLCSITVAAVPRASELGHVPSFLNGGHLGEVYSGGAFETLTSDGLAEAAATTTVFSSVFLGQAYCGGGAGEQAA